MDRAKEQIKFFIEIIKLLAVTLVGTIGGVLSFLADGSTTPQEKVFIGFGFALVVVLTRLTYGLYTDVQRMINALN